MKTHYTPKQSYPSLSFKMAVNSESLLFKKCNILVVSEKKYEDGFVKTETLMV